MIGPVDVIGPVIVAVHVNEAAHVAVAEAVGDRRAQPAVQDQCPLLVPSRPWHAVVSDHGFGYDGGLGPVHGRGHDHVGVHDHGIDHGGLP